MKPASKEYLSKVLLRRRMYFDNDTLEPTIAFIAGFDTACGGDILDGFREWLLANFPQCNGPFGWGQLVRQALHEEDDKNAVEAFIAILTRFLEGKSTK